MEKRKKPQITILEEKFDTATCQFYYEVTVIFDDKPDLKLGDCEVIQK